MNAHSNRVAVVTGGARGIGQALCVGLAKSGARVVGVDVGDLRETGDAVLEAGGEWLGVTADVSSPESVDLARRTILDRFKTCDILVNNAGIWPVRRFEDLEFAEWRKVMAVNLDSQFLMSKALFGAMKTNSWGRIVNLTSGSVLFPVAEYAAYKASKMGVIGLTRGMSIDLGRYGITVNAVSPALTPTPGVFEHGGAGLVQVLEQVSQMQAIKRVSTPNDVVGLILFLTSEAAGFISGQTILADGGLSYL